MGTMKQEEDEMDFPACCFCDKKYGSDACLQCPAYDGWNEEEKEDDWDDDDYEEDED